MNRTEERYKRKERYDTREQKRDNGWKHGRSHGLLLFHGSGGHLSHYAFVAYGGGSRRVGSKGKEEYFWQTGETDGDAVGGGERQVRSTEVFRLELCQRPTPHPRVFC